MLPDPQQNMKYVPGYLMKFLQTGPTHFYFFTDLAVKTAKKGVLIVFFRVLIKFCDVRPPPKIGPALTVLNRDPPCFAS